MSQMTLMRLPISKSKAFGVGARAILAALLLLTLQDSQLRVAQKAIIAADKSLATGQAAQAIANYRAALQAQPGDPWLLDRLTESSLTAQRPDMAAAFLEQHAALLGLAPAPYRTMADVRVVQGPPDQAPAYWRASPDRHPRDV